MSPASQQHDGRTGLVRHDRHNGQNAFRRLVCRIIFRAGTCRDDGPDRHGEQPDGRRIGGRRDGAGPELRHAHTYCRQKYLPGEHVDFARPARTITLFPRQLYIVFQRCLLSTLYSLNSSDLASSTVAMSKPSASSSRRSVLTSSALQLAMLPL